MAFPTWGEAGTAAAGGLSTPATISPAWPTHEAGDIGLLIVVSANFATEVTDLAGFEEIHVSPQQSGDEGQTSTAILRVYWKRATSAAEPAPTIAVPATQVIAKIVTIKGCGSGNPFDTMAGAIIATQGTALTWPALQTVNPESLIVGICAHSNDTTAEQASGYSNTSVSNMTERVDEGTNEGEGAGIVVWSATRTNPGNVLSTQATLAAPSRTAYVTLAFTAVNQAVDTTPKIKRFGATVESISGNLTVNWPTHEAGDVGILLVESNNWPITLATPAGFTAFNASPQQAGTNGATDATGLAVYWCRATSGSMTDPVVAFSPGDHVRAVIFTLKGCAGEGHPVLRSQGNVTTAPSNVGDFSGFTVADANCLLIGVLGHGRESLGNTLVSHSGSIPFATLKYDIGSEVGNGSGFIVIAGPVYQANTMANLSVVLEASLHQARILLAMRPTSGIVFGLEPGNFSLTGRELGFGVVNQFALLPGSFGLTGRDLTFTERSIILFQCEAGVFVIVGREAEIVKTIANWEKESPVDSLWTKDTPI